MRQKFEFACLALVCVVAGCDNAASPNGSSEDQALARRTILASDITVSVLPSPSGVAVTVNDVSSAGFIFGRAQNSSGQSVPYAWRSPYSTNPSAMGSTGFAAFMMDVNDYGDAGGQLNSGAAAVPGFWSPAGNSWTFTPVSTGGLPGVSVTIAAINNSRALAGFHAGGGLFAMYWSSPASEPETLPAPAFAGSTTTAVAKAMNNGGDVVGYAIETRASSKHSTTTIYHALLWHRGAGGWQVTVLPTLSPTDDRAYDINDAGQIAGFAGGAAALWTGVNDVYSGRIIVGGQSQLSRIDRCGRVVGSTNERLRRAWIWENGTTTYLPNPPGASESWPVGITTETSTGQGIIVGGSSLRNSTIPVRWTLPGCP